MKKSERISNLECEVKRLDDRIKVLEKVIEVFVKPKGK